MNGNRYGLNGCGSDTRRTADRAVVDAMNLVGAVRTLDPDEVWRQLRIWAINDRTRLCAAVTALAAMVDDTRTASEALAWTERLGQKEAA